MFHDRRSHSDLTVSSDRNLAIAANRQNCGGVEGIHMVKKKSGGKRRRIPEVCRNAQPEDRLTGPFLLRLSFDATAAFDDRQLMASDPKDLANFPFDLAK